MLQFGLFGLIWFLAPALILFGLIVLCVIRLGQLIDTGQRISEQLAAMGHIVQAHQSLIELTVHQASIERIAEIRRAESGAAGK